jgi:ribosome-interacting GTPase 1
MEEIWHRCNMIRIYTKPQGQIPDYDDPVILHSTNPTVEEFCNRLHKGIMAEFNYGKLSSQLGLLQKLCQI